MGAYGWTFLVAAITVGALALTGCAGAHAFGMAAGLLMVSLAAFTCDGPACSSPP